MTSRQRCGIPISGLMAARAVPSLLLRSARGCHVIGGPPLQRRRRCAEIETQARLVAGVAGRGHEGMLGGAHVRGAETAGNVVRRVAGTAVRSCEVRNVRRREHIVLWIVVVVIESQLREGSMALCAAAADARVQ